MAKDEERIKCKNCGGELEFFPAHQNLICTKCESEFNIEKQKFEKFKSLDLENAQKLEEEFSKTANVFNCENCGSKIVFSKLEYSAVCPYCGGVHIKKTRLNPGLMPDAVIPFQFNEKVASEKFKEAMAKKKFAPNAFKKAPNADDIYGIYIPTMCFNATSQTSYTGEARESTTDSDGKTSYRYYPIKGQISMKHENVLIESSAHINQLNFERLKPFKHNELVCFKDDYIRGYSVEYHETPLKVCNENAEEKMKFQIRSAIERRYLDEIVSLKTNTIYSNQSFAYFLLPIYQVDYKFKNKKYKSLINGQTGKVVGKSPVSKVKVWLLVLGILFGISALIALYLLIA